MLNKLLLPNFNYFQSTATKSTIIQSLWRSFLFSGAMGWYLSASVYYYKITQPKTKRMSKDTIHAVFKLQCCPANDPFPNNVWILLWFGLFFLAFSHSAFLEAYRNRWETARWHLGSLFLSKRNDRDKTWNLWVLHNETLR